MNILESNRQQVQQQLIEFKNLLNKEGLIENREKCEDELEKVKDYLWKYERSIKDIKKSNENGTDIELINAHNEFQLRFKSTFRSLNIDYKKKLEAIEHKELLEGRSKLKKDSLSHKKSLKQANEVTRSLQRTSELLVQEIEKSSNSAQALSESSQMMDTTNSEYKNIEGLTKTSGGLLSGLEIQAWIDRISLALGFGIFLFTVYWVISKRIYIPTLFPSILFRSGSKTAKIPVATEGFAIKTPVKATFSAHPTIAATSNDDHHGTKPLASDYISLKDEASSNVYPTTTASSNSHDEVKASVSEFISLNDVTTPVVKSVATPSISADKNGKSKPLDSEHKPLEKKHTQKESPESEEL
ncbi:Sec20-domain-containing protein [Conidiobolus coronatus NRRL 28638]|uniref:Sec20-domain-containing protein n=1 Tax=Conidiobolus coronatus (strain ATCC 28846 / CBS 209.66 / NRRL 28638) TaxID=796925 RepID=A0A137P5X7_CONC2|nr:Sec20-domain-containing protein [Conidiobolus coronatus NRRL 28638]|eukprot:KXN70396.1 Sec20-domain-containing protein [Conidiobolus coronatus NRRL 28638]